MRTNIRRTNKGGARSSQQRQRQKRQSHKRQKSIKRSNKQSQQRQSQQRQQRQKSIKRSNKQRQRQSQQRRIKRSNKQSQRQQRRIKRSNKQRQRRTLKKKQNNLLTGGRILITQRGSGGGGKKGIGSRIWRLLTRATTRARATTGETTGGTTGARHDLTMTTGADTLFGLGSTGTPTSVSTKPCGALLGASSAPVTNNEYNVILTKINEKYGGNIFSEAAFLETVLTLENDYQYCVIDLPEQDDQDSEWNKISKEIINKLTFTCRNLLNLLVKESLVFRGLETWSIAGLKLLKLITDYDDKDNVKFKLNFKNIQKTTEWENRNYQSSTANILDVNTFLAATGTETGTETGTDEEGIYDIGTTKEFIAVVEAVINAAKVTAAEVATVAGTAAEVTVDAKVAAAAAAGKVATAKLHLTVMNALNRHEQDSLKKYTGPLVLVGGGNKKQKGGGNDDEKKRKAVTTYVDHLDNFLNTDHTILEQFTADVMEAEIPVDAAAATAAGTHNTNVETAKGLAAAAVAAAFAAAAGNEAFAAAEKVADAEANAIDDAFIEPGLTGELNKLIFIRAAIKSKERKHSKGLEYLDADDMNLVHLTRTALAIANTPPPPPLPNIAVNPLYQSYERLYATIGEPIYADVLPSYFVLHGFYSEINRYSDATFVKSDEAKYLKSISRSIHNSVYEFGEMPKSITNPLYNTALAIGEAVNLTMERINPAYESMGPVMRKADGNANKHKFNNAVAAALLIMEPVYQLASPDNKGNVAVLVKNYQKKINEIHKILTASQANLTASKAAAEAAKAAAEAAKVAVAKAAVDAAVAKEADADADADASTATNLLKEVKTYTRILINAMYEDTDYAIPDAQKDITNLSSLIAEEAAAAKAAAKAAAGSPAATGSPAAKGSPVGTLINAVYDKYITSDEGWYEDNYYEPVADPPPAAPAPAAPAPAPSLNTDRLNLERYLIIKALINKHGSIEEGSEACPPRSASDTGRP
jgi:hypothetical protein